ncbi:hypothetical protein TCAL_15747 [Tigriopus californicus]|uniref:Uncharacterized protein n=1 Tax=Tigriopus californicus TaxID=6832 RepID=A0A553P879_TIGCA|nr:hypothetical protein TCAL_15747 [Tigriopus californicus]
MSTLGREHPSLGGSRFFVLHGSTVRTLRGGTSRKSGTNLLHCRVQETLINMRSIRTSAGSWHMFLSVWTLFTTGFDLYCIQSAPESSTPDLATTYSVSILSMLETSCEKPTGRYPMPFSSLALFCSTCYELMLFGRLEEGTRNAFKVFNILTTQLRLYFFPLLGAQRSHQTAGLGQTEDGHNDFSARLKSGKTPLDPGPHLRM